MWTYSNFRTKIEQTQCKSFNTCFLSEFPPSSASRRRTSIHWQRRPRDERRLVRDQKQRRVGDLIRACRAAHRVLAGALGDELLGVAALGALLVGAGDEDAKHRRVGGAGADDVD